MIGAFRWPSQRPRGSEGAGKPAGAGTHKDGKPSGFRGLRETKAGSLAGRAGVVYGWETWWELPKVLKR